MSLLGFLDTNILLYSISRDPSEAAKRDRATALIERDDVGISVQVLGEFYVQATRATRSDALPHAIAVGLIDAWLRFPLQEMTRPVLLGALQIKATHGFSYWDSTIIAAAAILGCRELYTEDLSHGQAIAGVRVINPFL